MAVYDYFDGGAYDEYEDGAYLGRNQILDSSNVMVAVDSSGTLFRSTGYRGIQVFEWID